MQVLILGNMGYVGPVLASHLRSALPGAHLVGYDSGLFAHAVSSRGRHPESALNVQIFGDVRDIGPELFRGMDAVVQLAAISNDPMGDRFAAVTDEINRQVSIRAAALARDQGVRHYVFASSCSIYGHAESEARSETSPVHPLTAYARSKVDAELALRDMDRGGMIVTCLRFATACGMSPRLRLDLVLNDFVASALATGQVAILSDGTPWRPLIDVADMARAIEWAIGRSEASGGGFLVVNTGRDEANYRVRDVADAVASAVPGTRVSVNPAAPPDRRSYRVDFSLYRALAPEAQPRLDLQASIGRLVEGLRAIDFADATFRESDLIRLRVLDQHIAAQRVSPALRWVVADA